MATTELPYQTYERLTGNTWTGGNTQPIQNAYKQYGVTLDATNPAGSSGANLALQAAMLKGLPASGAGTGTTPPAPAQTGVTVPAAAPTTNPVASGTDTRNTNDALGTTINNMADTTGLTSAYNTETGTLNDRMTQLEADQASALQDINNQFDEAQTEQSATQAKSYAGTSTNLVTSGGGFLGSTASHAGVLQGLQQTFDQQKTALLQQRDAAINQAKSAYDDKQFAVAEQLASEAKGYQDDLYQKQKDFASAQMQLANETQQNSEFTRSNVEKDLSAYTDIAGTSDNVTLDPAKVSEIDNFYGVPGYTAAAVKIAQNAAKATTTKAQTDNDIAIQTLLAKIPAGQSVTLGGQSYVGTKKAATGTAAGAGVISPLVIQQIPQLAPLAGMKEKDIITSLELEKPPEWFMQFVSQGQQIPYAPGKAPTPDVQAQWDAFRNSPDATSYRNTIRLDQRQAITGADDSGSAY